MSFLTLCQEVFPQEGQFMRVLGFPPPFQRMPPRSQMERLWPHLQITIHCRDSASMLAAQEAGTRRVMIFCSMLMGGSLPKSAGGDQAFNRAAAWLAGCLSRGHSRYFP